VTRAERIEYEARCVLKALELEGRDLPHLRAALAEEPGGGTCAICGALLPSHQRACVRAPPPPPQPCAHRNFWFPTAGSGERTCDDCGAVFFDDGQGWRTVPTPEAGP
jgi:hypothetical protein